MRQLESQPRVVEFIVARAQIDISRGASATALRRLEAALTETPASYALNITYAETALALGEPVAAMQSLQNFLDFRSDEPRIYQLMARAAGDQDKQAQGHAYMAEYYYRTGDIKAAILQLEIALKRPELNFYETSKLESRLTQFKAERDEEEEKR
jgi:predicted Zn-dependent protease